MLTKKIPTQILAIILAMPLLVVYADDNVVCLGDNYEQGLPIPNVNLPTVSLTSEGNVAKIYEGDSLTLFTNATVDTQNGANPNFYWCAEQGQLEIDPTAPDLSQVKYIAPAEVTENTWVRVVVQLSDGLGYVSGKSLFLNVSPITYYFVEGYLYNKYGHTIPDAPVEVAGHTAVTDENGYYKINELRAGNYTLTASKDGYNFTPIEITVGENETNTISLISDDPTPCLLYAVHDEGKKPIYTPPTINCSQRQVMMAFSPDTYTKSIHGTAKCPTSAIQTFMKSMAYHSHRKAHSGDGPKVKG